jgi:hypothetical protein
MKDEDWERFFIVATTVLGKGCHNAYFSENWCAFTTFSKLRDDCHYWTTGLPELEDISSTGINDGGVWGQPFRYSDLAHIIIPQKFTWEFVEEGKFLTGIKTQDIDKLAKSLAEFGIIARVTDLVLEIKLY